MLFLLMQLIGQSDISCTSDPDRPTPAQRLVEVSVDAGHVELTAWDRDSLDVQVVSGDASGMELRREAGHWAYCKRRTGPGHQAPPITVRLRVPFSARVQVNTREAHVVVRGTHNGAHVRSRGGNISLDSVSGRVQVDAVMGEVVLRDLPGFVSVRSTAGSVVTHGLSGSVEVSTNAAIVNVRDNASRSLTIITGSGDLSVAGRFLPNGVYRLNTDRGNITLRPAEPFNADVTAGAVRGEWQSPRQPTQGTPPRPGSRSEMRFGLGGSTIHITTLSGVISVH